MPFIQLDYVCCTAIPFYYPVLLQYCKWGKFIYLRANMWKRLTILKNKKNSENTGTQSFNN